MENQNIDDVQLVEELVEQIKQEEVIQEDIKQEEVIQEEVIQEEVKIDHQKLFLDNYKPTILINDPLYIFKVINSNEGDRDFYCYYVKKNLKIYFAKDCPLGQKVFDKDNIDFDKIDASVNFCRKFLNDYNNL